MSFNINGPDPGFTLATIDQWMTSTNAGTRGDVVLINTTVVANGKFTTVTQPSGAAALEGGIFAVAMEDVAAGEEGRFRFRGHVDVLVNGAVVLPNYLAAVSGQDYLDQSTAADKQIAIPLEAGTDTRIAALFDGISGFGHDNA